MKLGSSLLYLVLSAALAALAATGARPDLESTGNVQLEDVDAWFV